MLAGYNNYPIFTSQEQQIIMSWKTHCKNKRSSTMTPTPFFCGQSIEGTFTKVSEMNLYNTAEWIRNLGKSKMWSEADAYAQSFKNNNITGYLLDKLNTGSLKSELGITKYGHRLEIMAAIKDLYSNASNAGEEGSREADFPKNSSINGSSNDYVGRCLGEFGNELSYQNQTAAGRWMGKSVGAVENGYEGISSPVCNNIFNVSKHAQEVKKWVNPSTGSFLVRKWSNAPLSYICSKKSESSIADNVKGRSKRARPGNHIAYKALHTVTIQKGKSFSSCIVGQLLENSIVIINQIKGRRGRIVLKKPNGELQVVGWVPLFTRKGQQLLAKHKKKGGAEVQNSDATIEWKDKSPLEDLKQSTATDRELNESQVDISNKETTLSTESGEPPFDTQGEE